MEEEVFSDSVVEQAIANIADLVGMGMDDPEIPMKLVAEASYRVLDRKFGKPRETLELSHKIALRISLPGWGTPPPPPIEVQATEPLPDLP